MDNVTRDQIVSNFLKYCCFIDKNFLLPEHILRVGTLLNKFANNEPEYNKLIISLPPRMGKSYSTSVMLPSYLLGKNPKEKILTATYANGLTKTFSKQVLNIVNSEEYLNLFPGTRFINTGRSADTWDTLAGGYLKCSSRDGTLTGLTGTTIIVDDLIKNSKEARSQSLLKSIREWFDSTLFSRMTYQEDGTPPKIVILMTRWAKNDLIGHVLDNDERNDWKYFNLPAISINENGQEQALWEEKQPLITLKDIRKRDPEIFSCVYMGSPGSKGSTEFNTSEYIIRAENYIYPHDCRKKYLFSSWDTASKISENSNFTVGTQWAVRKTNGKTILTLEDYVRGKFTLPDLYKLIKEYHEKWNCKYTLIEDASSGTGIIQLFNNPKKFIGVQANVKKKLSAVIPALEEKQIELRSFNEILDELEEYPYGETDDCVASVVNAIYYYLINIATKRNENGITAIFKELRHRQKKLLIY